MQAAHDRKIGEPSATQPGPNGPLARVVGRGHDRAQPGPGDAQQTVGLEQPREQARDLCPLRLPGKSATVPPSRGGAGRRGRGT